MRFPDAALEYGIDQLKTCFVGLPEDVVKIVHLCCGYPDYLVSQMCTTNSVLHCNRLFLVLLGWLSFSFSDEAKKRFSLMKLINFNRIENLVKIGENDGLLRRNSLGVSKVCSSRKLHPARSVDKIKSPPAPGANQIAGIGSSCIFSISMITYRRLLSVN